MKKTIKYNLYRQSVFNYLDNKFHCDLIKSSDSRKEVEEFIMKQAKDYNCGIYRYWKCDGGEYFDCGNDTYFLKIENTDLEG